MKFFLLALIVSSAYAYDCPEITVTPLFLQPGASNLYYGAEAEPLPVPTPNWKSLEIKPDYHFAFELGLKSYLDCGATAVELRWEHLNSKDTASRTVATENMVGPYFNIGPDEDHYKSAKGKVSHHFDSVNLYLSRSLISEDCFTVGYFGGINFTRLKQTLTSNYSNPDETITRNIKSPSEFIGAGPEIGLNGAYKFCGNFSLKGEGSMGLLIGSLKNQTTFKSNSPLLAGLGIAPPNTQSIHVPNRTQVVPRFAGRLGFVYETCFCDTSLIFDLGYRAEIYLNAIQSVDMASDVALPPSPSEVGVYVLGLRRTLSNFFVSGPYLALTAKF